MKQYILRFSLLMLVSTHTLAATLDAGLTMGHDDNPFTLAEKFSPEGAAFVDTRLRLRQQFEAIRLTAQIDHRSYDENFDKISKSNPQDCCSQLFEHQ